MTIFECNNLDKDTCFMINVIWLHSLLDWLLIHVASRKVDRPRAVRWCDPSRISITPHPVLVDGCMPTRQGRLASEREGARVAWGRAFWHWLTSNNTNKFYSQTATQWPVVVAWLVSRAQQLNQCCCCCCTSANRWRRCMLCRFTVVVLSLPRQHKHTHSHCTAVVCRASVIASQSIKRCNRRVRCTSCVSYSEDVKFSLADCAQH